ncbi:MAG: DUF4190 domain-containing protein [Chloracidobacterium sp.]|nr:DUF4190 domain-containing protein [Chloracidobacterium sp.]
MKKCPTCDKTYEDSMKFCQLDGATLVDDEPAFDPYATIVSTPAKPIEIPPIETEPEPVLEVEAHVEEAAAEEPEVHQTVGSIAIAPPDEVLELPDQADPLKTMYASDTEMKEILGDSEPVAEEIPLPEPPAFIAPEPPPSPFSMAEEPAPEPVTYEEPAPAAPVYDEPATIIQPSVDIPFAAPAPVAEWTPPPAPDAAWQNQQIGSNTPFQPPPAGVGGQNKTLPIVSLVLGIISLCCYISPITGLAALITGYLGMKNIKNDPNTFGGKGLAMAGMICGGIFFLLGIVYWIYIIFVIGFAAMSGGFR